MTGININNTIRNIFSSFIPYFPHHGQGHTRVTMTVCVVQFYLLCLSFIKQTSGFYVLSSIHLTGTFWETIRDLARKGEKYKVLAFMAWRSHNFLPTNVATIVFHPYALKATIQEFSDLQVLQTPVKIVFPPKSVISIFKLALRFVCETSVVRTFMWHLTSFISATGLVKHMHNHSTLCHLQKKNVK